MGSQSRLLQTNPDDFETSFKGLEVTLQKRFSNHWQGLISYAYRHGRPEPGRRDDLRLRRRGRGRGRRRLRRGQRLPRPEPARSTTPRGRRSSTARTCLKANVSYEIQKLDMNVAAAFKVQTGTPYGRIVSFSNDVNGVGFNQGPITIYAEPRDSNRFDTLSLLDLRVSKFFRLQRPAPRRGDRRRLQRVQREHGHEPEHQHGLRLRQRRSRSWARASSASGRVTPSERWAPGGPGVSRSGASLRLSSALAAVAAAAPLTAGPGRSSSWTAPRAAGVASSGAPTATPGRSTYILETTGAGVAFLDYDGDGRSTCSSPTARRSRRRQRARRRAPRSIAAGATARSPTSRTTRAWAAAGGARGWPRATTITTATATCT